MSEYGDMVAAALGAEAEAARAEIRAVGIVCPSCETNMADLPDGHLLDVSRQEPYTAKCAAGKLVELPGASAIGQDGAFETWQAVANITVWDDFNRGWDASARKHIIGEQSGGGFTGLLGILKSE